MKFGQLIKYNKKNIFLVKPFTKCGGETTPRLFSKKSKLNLSLNQLPKVLYSLFLLYAKLRTIEIYWNYAADYLLLPYKAFLKNKMRFGTSLSASFSTWFLKKNVSPFIFNSYKISLSGCLYFVRHWAICVSQLFINQVLTS